MLDYDINKHPIDYVAGTIGAIGDALYAASPLLDYLTPSVFRPPKTPFGMWIRDARNNAINKSSQNAFGFTAIKPNNITHLSTADEIFMRELLSTYKDPTLNPRGTWDGSDWDRYRGKYTEGNEGVIERNISPQGQMAHILGKFDYHTDSNGNVIVTDTYDFNHNRGTTSPNALYNFFRNKVAPTISTSSLQPDDGKYHFSINLGNPQKW